MVRKFIHLLFPTASSQKTVWVGYYNLQVEYGTPFQGKWKEHKTCRLYEVRESYLPDENRFTDPDKYLIRDVYCMYVEPCDTENMRFQDHRIYFDVEKYKSGVLEMYSSIRPLTGPVGLTFAMRELYDIKDLPPECDKLIDRNFEEIKL